MDIGFITTTTSHNYGTYNLVCVAQINWRKFTPEQYVEWCDKYHPANYFRAYGWMCDAPDTAAEDLEPMKFSIPLEVENSDWKQQNADCLYLQNMKGRRVKGLPIAVPTKVYNKWVEASKQFLDAHLEPA